MDREQRDRALCGRLNGRAQIISERVARSGSIYVCGIMRANTEGMRDGMENLVMRVDPYSPSAASSLYCRL